MKPLKRLLEEAASRGYGIGAAAGVLDATGMRKVSGYEIDARIQAEVNDLLKRYDDSVPGLTFAEAIGLVVGIESRYMEMSASAQALGYIKGLLDLLRHSDRFLNGGRRHEADNVCEHGDHPAPEGRRFCSKACEECESTDQPDGSGCAGICLRGVETTSQEVLDRALWLLALEHVKHVERNGEPQPGDRHWDYYQQVLRLLGFRRDR